MTSNPHHNPNRWSPEPLNPADATRLEAEAKARGLSDWQHRMAQTVDDKMVADLVADGRTFYRARSKFNMVLDIDRKPLPPLEPVPLNDPHTNNLVDRVAKAFEEQDRAEALAKRVSIANTLKGSK
jgi:hypothetical protein